MYNILKKENYYAIKSQFIFSLLIVEHADFPQVSGKPFSRTNSVQEIWIIYKKGRLLLI